MLFADLKAAFDKVGRETLWKALKRKGIKTKAVSRIEKIYEETVMAVRTRQGYTDSFKTRKGVRQGCMMSPLLFNMYIANLDKEMKERNIGGMQIGKQRI